MPNQLPRRTYAPRALHHDDHQADAGPECGPQHGCGPHNRINAGLQVQRAGQHLQQHQGEGRPKGAADEDAGPAGQSRGSYVARVGRWNRHARCRCGVQVRLHSGQTGRTVAAGIPPPAPHSHEEAAGHDECGGQEEEAEVRDHEGGQRGDRVVAGLRQGAELWAGRRGREGRGRQSVGMMGVLGITAHRLPVLLPLQRSVAHGLALCTRLQAPAPPGRGSHTGAAPHGICPQGCRPLPDPPWVTGAPPRFPGSEASG